MLHLQYSVFCHPQNLIIMGAPGTSYWTGSVLVFNTSSGGMSVYLDDESGTVSFGSYLGKYTQCLFRLIFRFIFPSPFFCADD